MASFRSCRPAGVPAVLLFLAFVVHAPAILAQDAVPDLTGVWRGPATGGVVFGQLGHQEPADEPRFKDLSVVWTLTIEEQNGRGVIGTWSSPNHSELVLGVIHSDNEIIYFVDGDTHFNANLRSKHELELCLQETSGDSMVATCYILERQQP